VIKRLVQVHHDLLLPLGYPEVPAVIPWTWIWMSARAHRRLVRLLLGDLYGLKKVKMTTIWEMMTMMTEMIVMVRTMVSEAGAAVVVGVELKNNQSQAGAQMYIISLSAKLPIVNIMF
jgi:hypothetical protein